MLNRRILRAKTVQYLYGLLQSHTANYHLAIENIKDDFAPDLNSMEPQDRVQLAQDSEKAIEIFSQNILKKQSIDPTAEASIKKAVVNAKLFLENHTLKDTRFTAQNLISQTEEVQDTYVLVLHILVKIMEFLEETIAKKHTKPLQEFAIKNKLANNYELQALKLSDDVHEKIADLVYVIYRDQLSANTELEKLCVYSLGSIEVEKELVKDFIKTELFKTNLFENLMEEQDFDWSENKSAVKDLVTKTLKNVTEETLSNKILIGISANWDDDKLFMQELFSKAIEHKEEYNKHITDKLQNWDLTRIAEIDLAILVVAIAEMVHFPSIPVKVSINEYLEIAKVYGTPKSKDFINGILDKISAELVDKEIIKKSGRGLIDNK